MAKKLKIRVTAEGVETLDQLRVLRELGCDCIQGYLFSHPVPPHAIPALVAAPLLAAG